MEPERDELQQPSSDAPSKSARKRAHRSLQALGEALLELAPAELERVPLDADLRAAVDLGRGLRKGARVRQVRHLGNLLARCDWEPIRAAVDGLRKASAAETGRLHRLERWRAQLIEEGDAALEELVRAHPELDRQRLRALVRAAREERARGAPPRRFRELLRHLRSILEADG